MEGAEMKEGLTQGEERIITGKFKNIMEMAVLFASAFSIITLIDVIIKWVIGG